MSWITRFRQTLRSDLESTEEDRRFGQGWISGVAALVIAVSGLFFVLCLRFPAWLTVPEIRALYTHPAFRIGLYVWLVFGFLLAITSLLLRQKKVLGFTSLFLIVLSTTIGGSAAVNTPIPGESPVFFGLDWFVLNVIFTGFLFIPLETLFPWKKGQTLFRFEWREDLFYYLVSSMLVQCLTYASMWPALELTSHTQWDGFRKLVSSQPIILQFIEIMIATDLVQYWVHRAFHRIPFLWRFHAVHHSAQVMDWMAGARMHFLEIIFLRGFTVIPMYILGFSADALHIYILYVYIHSTFIHANIGWSFPRLSKFLVTPRFHHWHHGLEKEAIDVNFAIHFPALDRMFGTHYLPKDKWPEGYGIPGHPVPPSYWQQFLYPFRRK